MGISKDILDIEFHSVYENKPLIIGKETFSSIDLTKKDYPFWIDVTILKDGEEKKIRMYGDRLELLK